MAASRQALVAHVNHNARQYRRLPTLWLSLLAFRLEVLLMPALRVSPAEACDQDHRGDLTTLYNDRARPGDASGWSQRINRSGLSEGGVMKRRELCVAVLSAPYV